MQISPQAIKLPQISPQSRRVGTNPDLPPNLEKIISKISFLSEGKSGFPTNVDSGKSTEPNTVRLENLDSPELADPGKKLVLEKFLSRDPLEKSGVSALPKSGGSRAGGPETSRVGDASTPGRGPVSGIAGPETMGESRKVKPPGWTRRAPTSRSRARSRWTKEAPKLQKLGVRGDPKIFGGSWKKKERQNQLAFRQGEGVCPHTSSSLQEAPPISSLVSPNI